MIFLPSKRIMKYKEKDWLNLSNRQFLLSFFTHKKHPGGESIHRRDVFFPVKPSLGCHLWIPLLAVGACFVYLCMWSCCRDQDKSMFALCTMSVQFRNLYIARLPLKSSAVSEFDVSFIIKYSSNKSNLIKVA